MAAAASAADTWLGSRMTPQDRPPKPHESQDPQLGCLFAIQNLPLGGSLRAPPHQSCVQSSCDAKEQRWKRSVNRSSPGPWTPLQEGVAGLRKGVSPQAPGTQLFSLHLRQDVWCLPGEHACHPLGPAPVPEQRVALTMMEKMRGMRLRGQTGQKQEAMARIR